jgi:glycine dehydrogenase subunit 1
LADKGVLGGVSLGRLFPDALEIGNGMVVAVTETVTPEDIETFAKALEEELA